MGWDEMKNAKESGLFIKLKSGDAVEGVFRGEPRIFYQTFKDYTEYESWAEGRSFKFRLNFLVKEGDSWVAKIYQGGAMVRDAILACREEYGLDCIFKIKRTGAGKEDTVYSVLFKDRLTPEQIKEIDSVKLKELAAPVVDDEAPPF